MGGASAFGAAKAPTGPVTFEKDVRPILKAHCFHCHGEEGEMKGGLDVRLARFLAKGGKSGPAIVAGQPATSHILEVLKNGDMPKGKPPLKASEIAAIEKWIAAGAPTARPEPEKLGPEHAFTDEERAWWAFQPIQRPKVPAVKGQGSTLHGDNAIDAFLKVKLDKAGLAFSSEADRATLIRRATYDLTGLPPSPEEVDAFVNDSSPQAWEKVIERLLSSPHYGERWGRHWLDVAGYADSDGYTEKDTERPWAWKYRDYVIAAFNEDKPFDQFIQEQLAGDEMVKQPYRNLDAGAIEKLAATGFLRMAPDGTGTMNDRTSQNATIADTIKIVGTSLYGMTIACAQCHDHRYDPISQADYYRLRAVFEPGFDTNTWRNPAGRLVSLLTDAERADSAKIEAEAKKLDEARLKKQEEFITEVLEKELLKADEGIRDALRTAYRTVVKERKPEQVKMLKDWPRVNQLSGGSLYLYDTTYKTKHADTLKKMAEEATAVRATKPKEQFLQAFTEVPKANPNLVPATFIFHRGDPEQKKDKVPPSDLTVLAGLRKVELPEKSATLPTTGRRLAFAEAITDGKHPLLARVLVNRAWMHHFGKGIVTSAGDFGALGQMPTHPEMLDWLASEFMAQGWSMKQLHRLIMTSEAYRQSSTRDANKERLDPDNALLSRMNVRRLEAESLRDSMLAVSGKLAGHLAGKPVPVMANEEGQVVIGMDTSDTAGRPSGKIIPLNGEEFRRSIYVQVRRSKPLGMLETFDAPTMVEANCSERPSTTVSPQSLMLMNSGYMREYAQYFAMRLQKEHANDVKAQVTQAFRLAYGRAPEQSDIEAGVKFVEEQVAFYKAHPAPLEYAVGPPSKQNADASLLGLAALCHALMSANEFLYVD
ncbi:cytochrome c [Roseimicrobium gellanilyticum]|uniref:Cytochrome c n=1 Tax=Roseimicrobium gellanilyticum TaxID=748857 RepID=A0A366H1S6_9BACT|nr:PSD1 and planctomycete cytochrome C domain-containing protein [Roseimicrobium gellanilyticum]RBP35196.1 cytochrome c [Roseimicrobium gellanilyticum]